MKLLEKRYTEIIGLMSCLIFIIVMPSPEEYPPEMPKKYGQCVF